MDSSDPAHLQSIRNIGIMRTSMPVRRPRPSGSSITRARSIGWGRGQGVHDDRLPRGRTRTGITIVAAAITCRWKDVTINIIDTLGHVDFTAEVERSLRVLDGAVVIFSAVEGVEAQSETVWRQATRYHVPRLCFINKMDRIGAEFDRVFAEIQDRLESHPIPLQIPIGAGPEGTMGEFQGLIDLITMKALHFKTEDLGSTFTVGEIPEDLLPNAQLWRERMLDSLGDFDETFAEAPHGPPRRGRTRPKKRSPPASVAPPSPAGHNRSSVARASCARGSSNCSTRSASPAKLARSAPVVGHHPKRGTEVVP